MVVLQRHLATNNITTTKSIGTRNILCRTNTNKNEEFIYFYCFLKKNGKLKKKIYQSWTSVDFKQDSRVSEHSTLNFSFKSSHAPIGYSFP